MSSRVPIKGDSIKIDLRSKCCPEFSEQQKDHKNVTELRKELFQVRLETHMKVICHIEYAIQLLPEEEQFIIRNEVLYGKGGKWYLGYYTHSGYYKIRKKAYRNFLRCL